MKLSKMYMNLQETSVLQNNQFDAVVGKEDLTTNWTQSNFSFCVRESQGNFV